MEKPPALPHEHPVDSGQVTMDYWLTEEEQLVQSSFHDYLASECGPHRVRTAYDTDLAFDEELWRGFGELGFTGACIPAEHGGSGLGMMEAALLAEELGRHTAPLFLEGHILAGLALSLGGPSARQQSLLPKLASGELIGSLAIAAENSATDQPVELGEEGTVSLGMVPLADVADVIVVRCAKGQLGVLESVRTNVAACSSNGIDQSRKVFQITFDQAAVEPIPNLSGDALCSGLITLLSADAYGAADKLLELTVEYAKTREQFGQPIAQFQAVKHQLAEMALAVVTGRGLFWKAAREFDEDSESSAKSASMAKAHITDQAMKIARGAVELHGGIGFTWESDVHFYFKRLMFDRNYLGTPEVHRERCAELSGWVQ